jgi:hypothetical protein
MKRMAVLLLVAAAASAGSFAIAATTARGQDTLTFSLYGKNLEAAFLDLGPTGVSQGDIRVVNRELFNRHGARVGRVTVTCIIVETGDDPKEHVEGNCSGTFRLAGGEIDVQGIDSFQAVTTVHTIPANVNAVVGGTGVYQGVYGTLSFRSISPTVAENILRLHRR